MRGSAAFRTGVAPGGALAGPWVRNSLWAAARAVPSLDLRFADNKSLVDATTGAQLVTFTRASSGTYVDSQGVIKTATTNLLLRSEEFDNASWLPTATHAGVTANDAVAPTGQTTADLFSCLTTDDVVRRLISTPAITVSNATVYTASIYVKAKNWTFVGIALNANTTNFNNSAGSCLFNLSTGEIRRQINLTNSSAIDVGNGWWRVSITATTVTTTATLVITLQDADEPLANTAVGVVGNGVYVFGAQLEQSSTVGEYIPTTSTINSASRFDHNPTTGESLGLLVEEQRTNLLLQSEDFGNAAYTVTAGSITTNTVAAPDGTTTADTVSSTGTTVVSQSYTKAASSITYAASLFVKGTVTALSLTVDDGGTTNRGRCIFNLSTGTLTSTTNEGTFTGTIGSITPFPNGWYRLVITTTTNTLTTARHRFFWTGSGTSIDVWGAQLEAGAFATSYIPTTTATATRSADVASISGSNFSVSRTNLLLRSEEFDNATWTKVNTTVSSNAASAPDGTTTADKLITDSGIVSTSAHIRQTVSKAATATTYTLTVFAKTGDTGTGTLQLIAADAATTANSATSNFSTVSGTIPVAASSQGTFTNASSTITPLDNDWYRCSLTFTSGTETSIQLRLYSRLPTTGDGTRGLLIWGSQLETGSAATAYIPTTSAAVTVVDSPWYRQDEGTMYGDFLPYHTAGRIFSLNNNSNSERIVLIRSSGSGGNINAFVTAGGVVQVNALLLGVSILPFTNNRAAFAYKTSDFAGSLNGLTPVTQGTGSLPTATQATLGNGEILGTNQLNGTIRRLCFWPIRLSNATLQQVTQ